MIVLGINAFHGDASAALFTDGRLVAAAEEERFTRAKHESGFPAQAVRYCLAEAGARLSDVDHVAIPRDPRARLARKLWYALRMPRFAADRVRAGARTGGVAADLVRAMDEDPARLRATVHRIEHHRAHLASAFFASPFDRAAVLSLDGLGDFGSAAWGVGEGTRLRLSGGVAFPHSVGLWYTAVTQFLGFPHYGDEYKVMGLAAAGEPALLDRFREMVRTCAAPGYTLDLACFAHHRRGPRTTWDGGTPALDTLYGAGMIRALGPAREAGSELTARHRDIAASLQARLEEVVVAQAGHATRSASSDRLAYAGGVAFNCVANARLASEGPVHSLFVPPAAGDGGLSLGAALAAWHEVLGRPRDFVMEHAAWGPSWSADAIAQALAAAGLEGRRLDETPLVEEVARRLDAGQVVGWFQGRAEFGPRALGQRSILADPRRPEMKDTLNGRVKHREAFRPFAPSVAAERAADWFDGPASPFMLLALPVRAERRAAIPAVTHLDGTARVQAVARGHQPLYWALLDAFSRRTGVPVLLNTSFNDQEPIVHSPEDAIRCYRNGGLDALAIGPWLVARTPAGS